MEELLAKLAEAERERERLQEELVKAKKTEHLYNNAVGMGEDLCAVMRGLTAGGLTHEQAWQVVMESIRATLGGAS